MKILFLHNKYLISGGEDVSTASEIELLKAHGHSVDAIIIDNGQIKKISRPRLMLRTIWSVELYKQVKNVIRTKKYDLVHVQNYFPLISPSVFYAAKSSGVKVVMSVRNYRLICPNALLYVNNQICTQCVGKKMPYPGVVKKCYRNSYASSFVSVLMLFIHNVLNTWNKKIDGLICISDFVKSQLILGGLNPEKMYVKYNFLSDDPGFNENNEDYYLYVGRLSVEKGVKNMIDAFKVIGSQSIKHKLLIIGDGPLTDYVKQNANNHFNNINYLGRLPLSETYNYMKKAKYLIFPSDWNEPFGRTIIEAFAHGTPVIGSNSGGVKELIINGENGFLYKTGDVYSLIDVINNQDKFDYKHLRLNARKSYLDNFTAERNYEQLMEIYDNVLNN